MMPYQVVADFEKALCEYTGATRAVTTTSCTMALMLSLKFFPRRCVAVPKRTYVGVPMSVINAGHDVHFYAKHWVGAYRLDPLPVWDSARWFTKGIFSHLVKGRGIVCVSFHASKTLCLEQGGAILHNLSEAHHETLLRLRFDGRLPGEAAGDAKTIGYHCPMIPSVAAAGLMKLSTMKDKIYDPIPNDDYPDLSTLPPFQDL